LKSPIYTIEEKYADVEKYLCGFQLSYEKTYIVAMILLKRVLVTTLK
jgi:hypothetical protein